MSVRMIVLLLLLVVGVILSAEFMTLDFTLGLVNLLVVLGFFLITAFGGKLWSRKLT